MEASTWNTCRFFVGPPQVGHIPTLFTVQKRHGCC